MSAGVRIIMFGRQRTGKGTQSARLAKYFDVPHISTGEMLRNAVKQDSVVGRSAKAVLDRGELVDDDLMVSLVQGRIGQEDARTAGFVLDGFPRTIGQATAFDALTQMRPVGSVVDLDVAREIVVGRLSSRRTCERCDAIYTATGKEPNPWKCEKCGGPVRIIASIEDPDVIQKILKHLGLDQPDWASPWIHLSAHRHEC